METRWILRLLAGLQAGVIAGMLMSGWLMIESMRGGRSIAAAPNLVSTALLGRHGFTSTLGAATLAGLSLQLVIAGLHGVLFAALLPPTARPIWAANAGILFSMASYTFFFGWALGRLAPILYHNAPRPAWMGGYFLFGVILGLYPDFARSLLPQEKPPPQMEPIELPPPLPEE